MQTEGPVVKNATSALSCSSLETRLGKNWHAAPRGGVNGVALHFLVLDTLLYQRITKTVHLRRGKDVLDHGPPIL